MSAWLPAMVDLALAILLVEAIALIVLRGRHRLPMMTVVLISLSGMGLLVALRAALADGPALMVLAGLTVAGLAHAIDLSRRLRNGSPK